MGFEQQTSGLAERVFQVALPLCEAENYELVHVECATSNREKIVRLFVDKPGGITLDDCVYISRQLGDLIDVQIEDIGSYRLEVSSPGPNRPLTRKKDFYRFSGQKIKIETHEPIVDQNITGPETKGQKKFTGILETVNDTSIILDIHGKKVEISDLKISKAMLAGD